MGPSPWREDKATSSRPPASMLPSVPSAALQGLEALGQHWAKARTIGQWQGELSLQSDALLCVCATSEQKVFHNNSSLSVHAPFFYPEERG